ncbi:hypothetical protein ES703_117062 [subsurface metagenome]
MNGNWYDTAQICTNGHVINEQLVSSPHINKKFCDKCGTPTITNCQYCRATIKGAYHFGPNTSSWKRPSFCPDCGKPYPWTEAKLKAAQELSDELANLSLEERSMLKKSLDDIIRDTPQTTVAANRFKKLVAKAGKVAADGFRDILVDVLSETAKKIILESK